MKKVLSVFLVFAFLLTSTVFAAPVNITPIEGSEEKTQTEMSVSETEADLQAVTSAPGLNILGGEAGAVSFENEADISFKDLFYYYGIAKDSAKIVDNPHSDAVNSSAKAFAFDSNLTTGTGQDYPNIRASLPTTLEAERPMYVAMKIYRSNPGERTTDFNPSGHCWWIMKNGADATDIMYSKNQEANADSWYLCDGYVDFTKGGNHKTNTSSIAFQANRFKDDKYATTYYMDDMAIIPGYKITYKLNDGTVAPFKTEYVKCDLTGPEGGDTYTLTSDIPTDETATFIGWALTDDAAEADCIDTVTLANKDVTVYAVWDGDPSAEVSTEPVLQYTFDDDTQNWSAWGSIACTQNDGALSLIRSKNEQGAINSPTGLNLDTEEAKYIRIRVKNGTTGAQMKFYFDNNGSYDEAKTFSFTMPTSMSDYQELTIKLSDIASWKGTVNKFMVAIYSVEGEVLIDEMSFYTALPGSDVVTPTILYDFEDGLQGWSTGGQATVTAKDGIMTFTQNIASGYAAMYTPMNLALTPASARYFVVRVKNASSSSRIHFYFAPNNSTYSEANSLFMPIEANMTDYKTFVFDTSTNAAFKAMSVINRFMVNVSAQGVCEFDSVGFYAENPVKEVYPVTEYTFDSDKEDWSAWGINGATWKTGGYLSISCTGSGQGAINSPSSIGLTSDTAKYLNIRAKNNSSVSSFKFYFQGGTVDFNEEKTFSYPITAHNSDYVDYVLDMSKVPAWSGNIDRFMLQYAGTDGTLDIDYIRFYTTLPENLKPEEVSYSMKLTASATSITTDKGTVTVTPTVKATGTGVAKTVSYSTDNNNALVTKNEDGTLTVQGMINGKVTVTAISDYDKSITSSVTITISGQADRTAAYDMNMYMYGNSILKHGVAESLGWYGNYGMAASSIDKDYVHRLKYYLSDKYGTVEQSISNFASFEIAIKAQDNYDYSSELSFVKGDLTSLSSVPEIVTIQIGENVSASGLTASQYKNAVKQLIQEIRKYAPDAQIVVCTPFWGGDAKIQGIYEAAKELGGIRVANLHTLNTAENKAGNAFANSGVQAHPGDVGMDNIAKLIYAELNTELTENVKPEYVVAPLSLAIKASSDKITTAYGTLSLSVEVNPSEADSNVKWTSNNDNIATVDENGVVTAKNNGVVTITAASKVNDTKATYDITISGQTPSFTLTYDANTTDTVTGMPEANDLAKENTTLSNAVPERKYYIFAGWSADKNANANETVSSLYVTGNTTVYAIWRDAVSWDFETDGNKQGITIENGFNVNVVGGKLTAIATDTNEATGNVIKFVSPELKVNSADYQNFVLRMQNTARNDSTKVELTIVSDVDTYVFTKQVTSIENASYLFDISSVEGTITGFSIKPTNIDCTINIEEMGFAQNTVTYHANTTDEVTGMPQNDATLPGKYTVSTATPKRTGYTFIGWGTTPSSILASEYVMVDGNVDLYAIWDSNTHWEFNTASEFENTASLGNSTLLGIVDGAASINASSSSDPIVNLKNIAINASKFKNIEVRIAYQLNSAASTKIQFYFTTDTETSLSESKSVSATLDGQNSDGFVTVNLNMASSPSWKGTVKALRLDPITGYGNLQIDYIRFTDDDGAYIYTIPNGYTTDGKDFVGHTNVLLCGGTLKPEGAVNFKNFAVSSGNIDTSKGMVGVVGNFETTADSGYSLVDFTDKPAGCPATYTVSDSNGNKLNSSDISSDSCFVLNTGKNGTYLNFNGGYDYNVIRRVNADGSFTDITGNPLLTSNSASIRSSGVQGIRFKASVNQDMFDRDTTSAKMIEYGFVVGLGKTFAEGTQPTLDDAAKGTAVTGIAYNSVKHVSYEFLDGRDVFTCVLKNIPMTKEALMEELVMVPYMKITNGVTTSTIYGESVRSSILSVAEAIEAVGGDDYLANEEYIDNIILTCYD